MHLDLVGTAFRTIIAAAVLIGTDQFLLLGVDRNHGLTGRLGGDHRGIDMLELRVAVRIVAAFQCLAVHLPAVFQQTQQFGDAAIGDPMTHLTQGRGQLRVAFRYPHQRPHRIAHRRGFNPSPQVVQQGWVLLDQGWTPAARPPNLARQAIRSSQVLQSPANRATGDRRRTRCGGDAAVAGRFGFRRHEKTPGPLVQVPRNCHEPLANR